MDTSSKSFNANYCCISYFENHLFRWSFPKIKFMKISFWWTLMKPQYIYVFKTLSSYFIEKHWILYFSSFQQLLEAHETFKQTLPEADKEFNAIMALASEVQRLANQVGLQLTDNPYTTVDPQVRTGVPLTRLMLHEEGCVKT